jgi:hypothetical protein
VDIAVTGFDQQMLVSAEKDSGNKCIGAEDGLHLRRRTRVMALEMSVRVSPAFLAWLRASLTNPSNSAIDGGAIVIQSYPTIFSSPRDESKEE